MKVLTAACGHVPWGYLYEAIPQGRGQGKTGWKSSNMWLATEGNSSVRDAASSLTESASYDSSGLAAVSAILGYQGQNITAQFDLM